MDKLGLYLLKIFALSTLIIAITILMTILNALEVKAAHIVEQQDVSIYLKSKYTIKDKINERLIDNNIITIKDTLNNIDFIKNINIKVIMSKHSINETNALTSKHKVNDYYVIIIANDNNQVKSTLLHELGHIIRFKYVNEKGYKRICYKDKNFKHGVEEEFAEDFRFWLNNDYKKRTGLAQSNKFKYLMMSVIKKINMWIYGYGVWYYEAWR